MNGVSMYSTTGSSSPTWRSDTQRPSMAVSSGRSQVDVASQEAVGDLAAQDLRRTVGDAGGACHVPRLSQTELVREADGAGQLHGVIDHFDGCLRGGHLGTGPPL